MNNIVMTSTVFFNDVLMNDLADLNIYKLMYKLLIHLERIYKIKDPILEHNVSVTIQREDDKLCALDSWLMNSDYNTPGIHLQVFGIYYTGCVNKQAQVTRCVMTLDKRNIASEYKRKRSLVRDKKGKNIVSIIDKFKDDEEKIKLERVYNEELRNVFKLLVITTTDQVQLGNVRYEELYDDDDSDRMEVDISGIIELYRELQGAPFPSDRHRLVDEISYELKILGRKLGESDKSKGYLDTEKVEINSVEDNYTVSSFVQQICYHAKKPIITWPDLEKHIFDAWVRIFKMSPLSYRMRNLTKCIGTKSVCVEKDSKRKYITDITGVSSIERISNMCVTFTRGEPTLLEDKNVDILALKSLVEIERLDAEWDKEKYINTAYDILHQKSKFVTTSTSKEESVVDEVDEIVHNKLLTLSELTRKEQLFSHVAVYTKHGSENYLMLDNHDFNLTNDDKQNIAVLPNYAFEDVNFPSYDYTQSDYSWLCNLHKRMGLRFCNYSTWGREHRAVLLFNPCRENDANVLDIFRKNFGPRGLHRHRFMYCVSDDYGNLNKRGFDANVTSGILRLSARMLGEGYRFEN